MEPPLALQVTPIGTDLPPCSLPTALKVCLSPGVRVTLAGVTLPVERLVCRRTTRTNDVSSRVCPWTRLTATTEKVPIVAAENRPSGRIVPPDVFQATGALTDSPASL